MKVVAEAARTVLPDLHGRERMGVRPARWAVHMLGRVVQGVIDVLQRYLDSVLHSIYPPQGEARTAPPRTSHEFARLIEWGARFEAEMWDLARQAVDMAHAEDHANLEARRQQRNATATFKN